MRRVSGEAGCGIGEGGGGRGEVLVRERRYGVGVILMGISAMDPQP